jgi:hypothetical protein
MIGIPGHVRGAAFVALDQHADGVRAERHRRGVKLRLAQNHSVGLLHVRNNELLRFPAAGNPRNGKRRRGELQEVPPVYRFIPLRGLPRKFAVQQILEMRIVRQLFERAPVLFAALLAQFRAHCRDIQAVLVHRQILGVLVGMIVCVHGSLVCVVIVHVAFDRVVFAHTVY